MLENISRKITGYVRVRIKGDEKSRFINICIKNGLRFWDYTKTDDCFEISMRIITYKQACKLKKKLKVNVKLIQKKGIPFALTKVRLGYIAGIFLSVLLYMFLFSHYWVVDVSIEGLFSEKKILEVAEQKGIYIGAKIGELNLYNIENQFMMEIPEIDWISINTDGCTVDIAVRIALDKPEIEPADEGVAHVIAENTGIVRSIEAREGIPLVEAGSAVAKGDILITGTWDSNMFKSEWKQSENPTVFEVSAKGVVMAEVNRHFVVRIPKTKEIYTPITNYYRFSFGLFGFEIPFVPNLVPSGNYEYVTETQNLYLFGVKLPIYVKSEKLMKIESSFSEYSQAEAELTINNLLDMKIDEELESFEKLLSRKPTNIYVEGEYLIGELDCTTLENIAITYKLATK